MKLDLVNAKFIVAKTGSREIISLHIKPEAAIKKYLSEFCKHDRFGEAYLAAKNENAVDELRETAKYLICFELGRNKSRLLDNIIRKEVNIYNVTDLIKNKKGLVNE